MTQSIKRYVYKGKHKDTNVRSTLLKVELCISIAIGIGYCGSIPHYALIINLIKMETIHSQIKAIKMQSKELENVVNNYNMGLITMSEKHNQLVDILVTIDKKSKEIQKEYGINSTAVNLMLELY